MDEGNDASKGRWYQDEQSLELYSDAARITDNFYSFLVEFGLQMPSSESATRVHLVARVRMSPQHAKALSRLLNERVGQYEEQTGQAIPSPEDMSTSDERREEER